MSSLSFQGIAASILSGSSGIPVGTVAPNKKPMEIRVTSVDVIGPQICDMRMAQMSTIYSKMGIVTATSSEEGGKK